ncbi:hypothetical protein ABZO31_08915 [Streptomyces sp. HUAS MG47]|uniref:hypothetical protein n=1 Tax=Streptomyces solicamelliae TaxID=3231716 RepID=UPI003877FF76
MTRGADGAPPSDGRGAGRGGALPRLRARSHPTESEIECSGETVDDYRRITRRARAVVEELFYGA